MNNPNLSLENAIRELNDHIRRETQELNEKRQKFESIGSQDKALQAEILRHEQEIKAKMAEIDRIHQEIHNEQRTLEEDKGELRHLKAEIDKEGLDHNKSLAALTETQRKYQDSLKSSGIKRL